MSGREAHASHRAELYVRSLVPTGSRNPQAAVIDRLTTLAAEKSLADVSTHIWGKQVPSSPAEARTDAGVYALDRVTVFRKWARHNGVSLDPAFELREVDAEITGDQYRSIVFPTFLLAEFRDGALVCVTPHETGDGVETVADRLAKLEGDAAPEYAPVEGAQADPPARTRIDRDPGPEPVAGE